MNFICLYSLPVVPRKTLGPQVWIVQWEGMEQPCATRLEAEQLVKKIMRLQDQPTIDQ